MRSSEVAKALNGRLLGEDADLFQARPLFLAGPNDLSAILYPKDIRLAKKSTAGALLADIATAAEYADEIPAPLIVTDNFADAFDILKQVFITPRFFEKKDGDIHPSAQVGRAFIGAGTKIMANAMIDDGVVIEEDCLIEPGVVISGQVHLGRGSIIKANSVIGSEGFVPFGVEPKNLSCLGNVRIEQGVKIGALCTIDRGLLGETTIKKGAMLDNMVHIGHDSIVGENTVIAAQSALAGFVRLGAFATCGGQVGIAPHVIVGDFARISGKTLVHCDIKPQEIWSGNPGLPHGIYLRAYARTMRKFRANK